MQKIEAYHVAVSYTHLVWDFDRDPLFFHWYVLYSEAALPVPGWLHVHFSHVYLKKSELRHLLIKKRSSSVSSVKGFLFFKRCAPLLIRRHQLYVNTEISDSITPVTKGFIDRRSLSDIQTFPKNFRICSLRSQNGIWKDYKYNIISNVTKQLFF